MSLNLNLAFVPLFYFSWIKLIFMSPGKYPPAQAPPLTSFSFLSHLCFFFFLVVVREVAQQPASKALLRLGLAHLILTLARSIPRSPLDFPLPRLPPSHTRTHQREGSRSPWPRTPTPGPSVRYLRRLEASPSPRWQDSCTSSMALLLRPPRRAAMDAELEAPADPASMTFAEQVPLLEPLAAAALHRGAMFRRSAAISLAPFLLAGVLLEDQPRAPLCSRAGDPKSAAPSHCLIYGAGVNNRSGPEPLPCSTTSPTSCRGLLLASSPCCQASCRRPATFVTGDRQIRSRWVGSSRPCLAAAHQRPSVSRLFWISKDETPRTVPGPSSTFSEDFAKYHDMNDPRTRQVPLPSSTSSQDQVPL